MAGDKRGATLEGPPSTATRPTSDRARESLFNSLQSLLVKEGLDWEDLHVGDIFAGTGALGLEALSRGARHATFVEYFTPTFQVLRRNVQKLSYENSSQLVCCDVLKLRPAPEPCQLVFLDPPYHKGSVPPALSHLQAQGWLAEGALVVVEVSSQETFLWPSFMEPLWDRVYGAAHLWIGRLKTTP